ncbi:hydroxymethylpyrimidine/phosphomethylpyrimidine kinase [Roseospirillum parvum]|uniref:hydroxymethylpyrimidine kinase n=1 Tax=Roseospirillum parvum TaxID=83401 RepID=A0A1G7XP74_9PROT|nr:hydroxymethylpyrimidine/phosphomethylpyrimidine kinase [Roseospirillum parvum]
MLIVAGSDSGGGAGIQADIKAVTCLRAYAMTAITALTAQNTEGVFGVHAVPLDFVRQQIHLVLDDLGADVVKTGMLATAEVITAVAEALAEADPEGRLPLVVDPVMVAKGGHRLLAEEAVEAMRSVLLPRATVITPNLPEAEALLGGGTIDTVERMEEAARELKALGPDAVLLKGGHLVGEGPLVDLLIDAEGGLHRFEGPRLATTSTHGTGCTLASALAASLAQGLDLARATGRARAYVAQAIATAPGFGRGHGPLNHAHTVGRFGGV